MKVKQHDIERSLLEGILTRGDRRVAAGAGGSLAARRPARRLERVLQAAALVADLRRPRHRRGVVLAARAADDEVLPWDHVNVKKGREYLDKEQTRSLVQLQVMADAK